MEVVDFERGVSGVDSVGFLIYLCELFWNLGIMFVIRVSVIDVVFIWLYKKWI